MHSNHYFFKCAILLAFLFLGCLSCQPKVPNLDGFWISENETYQLYIKKDRIFFDHGSLFYEADYNYPYDEDKGICLEYTHNSLLLSRYCREIEPVIHYRYQLKKDSLYLLGLGEPIVLGRSKANNLFDHISLQQGLDLDLTRVDMRKFPAFKDVRQQFRLRVGYCLKDKKQVCAVWDGVLVGLHDIQKNIAKTLEEIHGFNLNGYCDFAMDKDLPFALYAAIEKQICAGNYFESIEHLTHTAGFHPWDSTASFKIPTLTDLVPSNTAVDGKEYLSVEINKKGEYVLNRQAMDFSRMMEEIEKRYKVAPQQIIVRLYPNENLKYGQYLKLYHAYYFMVESVRDNYTTKIKGQRFDRLDYDDPFYTTVKTSFPLAFEVYQ